MQWKVVHFMLAINNMHAVLRVLRRIRQNKFVKRIPTYQKLSLLHVDIHSCESLTKLLPIVDFAFIVGWAEGPANKCTTPDSLTRHICHF